MVCERILIEWIVDLLSLGYHIACAAKLSIGPVIHPVHFSCFFEHQHLKCWIATVWWWWQVAFIMESNSWQVYEWMTMSGWPVRSIHSRIFGNSQILRMKRNDGMFMVRNDFSWCSLERKHQKRSCEHRWRGRQSNSHIRVPKAM